MEVSYHLIPPIHRVRSKSRSRFATAGNKGDIMHYTISGVVMITKDLPLLLETAADLMDDERENGYRGGTMYASWPMNTTRIMSNRDFLRKDCPFPTILRYEVFGCALHVPGRSGCG